MGEPIQMCEGCDRAPATTFDSEGIPLCEQCSTLPSDDVREGSAAEEHGTPTAVSQAPAPSLPTVAPDSGKKEESTDSVKSTRQKSRPHILPSAGYWFTASRKAQDAHQHAEAVMCMENAYNHVENALAATNDFIRDYVNGVLMRDSKTYGQRARELLSRTGGSSDASFKPDSAAPTIPDTKEERWIQAQSAGCTQEIRTLSGRWVGYGLNDIETAKIVSAHNSILEKKGAVAANTREGQNADTLRLDWLSRLVEVRWAAVCRRSKPDDTLRDAIDRVMGDNAPSVGDGSKSDPGSSNPNPGG